jgi:hypothetical protein
MHGAVALWHLNHKVGVRDLDHFLAECKVECTIGGFTGDGPEGSPLDEVLDRAGIVIGESDYEIIG